MGDIPMFRIRRIYDDVLPMNEQAIAQVKAVGLFYECLPDDPRLCRDPAVLKQNRARLHFYERYGARPDFEHQI